MLRGVIRIRTPGAGTHPAHAHKPANTSAVPPRTPAAAITQPSFREELTARHDDAGWSDYKAAEPDLKQVGSELKSGTYPAPDTDRLTLPADTGIALAHPTPPAGDAAYSDWLSGPGPGGADVALSDCVNAAASLDTADSRFISRLAATQAAAS